MRRWLVLVSSLVLIQYGFAQRSLVGQAITLQGFTEDSPKAVVQSAILEGQSLTLQTQSWTARIVGFPKKLLSGLVGSTLTPHIRLRPDGLEARLAFARDNESFLLLGVQSSPNTEVLVGWRFAFEVAQTSATIVLEGQRRLLILEKAVLLRQSSQFWCLRLLALHLPMPTKPGVASEAEQPRFDWAAWRVARAAQCQ